MARHRTLSPLPVALLGASLFALAACDQGGFDPDLRNFGRGGFDTTEAARNATVPRPATDSRGVISYPTYQVVVAQRGDTVDSIAQRVGLNPSELATYNAISPSSVLREGEVLALPRRVAGGAVPPTSSAPVGSIDVTTIASGAIDRSQQGATTSAPIGGKTTTQTTSTIGQTEPIRHKVQRGETPYSIARLYNVDVRALGDWNGLGPDLQVREGQTLLIPIAVASGAKSGAVSAETLTAPGQGSPTPTPPSATKPLPAEKTTPKAEKPKTPPAPDMGAQKTSASASKLAMPVSGNIVRAYQKGKNEGIDIAATPGTAVKAAGDGTVAAIFYDKTSKQPTVMVVRHDDKLLTVYTNFDGIAVAKGDRVKRGQTIAKVRGGNPAVLHFEVRRGIDSVDPMPYLQ